MNTMQLGPEEPGTDTKRLLIAVVASTLIFLVWQTFFFKPVVPKTTEAPSETSAVQATADVSAPEQPATPEVSADAVASTPKRMPEAVEKISIDVSKAAGESEDAAALKGGFLVTMTNQGAQMRGFELTGYTDPHQKVEEGQTPAAVDLVSGAYRGAQLVALRDRSGDVRLGADDAYELVRKSEQELVYSRLTPAGVRITRTYRFDTDRFAFTHEVTLKNESGAAKTSALDVVLVGAERPGERDEGGMFAPGTDQLGATCRAGGEQELWLSQELDEPESLSGQVQYVGIDRHFFLAALMPEKGTVTQACRVEGWAEGPDGRDGRGVLVTIEQAEIKLAPGAEQTFSHRAYFGPKQLQSLQQAGYGLDENIQFGWFGVLSRPMLWVLVWLYEHLGNFGIAIILLTLLMKALTFPLTQKSYVSMQQMKTLAPEMKKLQEKYGHDRAAMGQKQMELYKEKGISPLAGCFPVLVQMPIWFALYRTLWNSVELYQQPFYLGISDLSQPDALLAGFPLLPVLVGALMLVQTLMQPAPQEQPQMKYVMWGMPIMFTFFMLQMPSGLSLYMITNSLLTMAQQYYIKRQYA